MKKRILVLGAALTGGLVYGLSRRNNTLAKSKKSVSLQALDKKENYVDQDSIEKPKNTNTIENDNIIEQTTIIENNNTIEETIVLENENAKEINTVESVNHIEVIREKFEITYDSNFSSILVDDGYADIFIEKSLNDKTYVSVLSDNKDNFEISLEDDALEIIYDREKNENQRALATIKIALPTVEYENMELNSCNGAIDIKDFKAESISLCNVNNTIKLFNVYYNDIEVNNVNGSINLIRVTGDSMEVSNVNSTIEMNTVTADDLTIANVNEGIFLTAVSSDSFEINNVNAGINLMEIKGDVLSVTNTNSSISLKTSDVYNISLGNVRGDINISNVISDNLDINGVFSLVDIYKAKVESESTISSVNGNVKIKDSVFSGDLNVNTIEGVIIVEEVTVEGNVDLECESSKKSAVFNNHYFEKLTINSVEGVVRGKLKSEKSEEDKWEKEHY